MVDINNIQIEEDKPPVVIAEMSGNHLGNIERAFKIIDAIKDSGAGIVKLQTYTADTITIDSNNKEFLISGGLWDGYSLYELYKEAHTPWEWHKELFSYANEAGLTIFSSPFDPSAISFLEKLDCPAYKIASFEIVDTELIKLAAQTGKPLIISTGLASMSEIEDAVNAAEIGGCKELILMHCISGYPTPVSEMNLNTIPDLMKQFNVQVGLSDHTLGYTAAVSSIALGVRVIEKHVTLSREDGGPDAAFSLEPDELKMLVDCCSTAWQALGSVNYSLKESEKQNLIFRRSIYAVKNIKKGEKFTKENIKSIRPGSGLPPKYMLSLIGKTVTEDISKGTPISWGHVQKD